MSFFAEFSRSNLISSLDLILPLKSLFSRQGSHGWLSSPAFTVHLIEAAQFLLLQIYSHCVCWHRGVLLIQASLNAILDPIMTQMLDGAHDPSEYPWAKPAGILNLQLWRTCWSLLFCGQSYNVHCVQCRFSSNELLN